MSEPHLIIRSANSQKRLRLRADKPVTVGRHPSNVIALADEKLSRFHCVIEAVGTSWRVRDLDSRNGTRLNGSRVGTSPLKDGDAVTVGGIELKLVVPAAEPAQTAEPVKAGARASAPAPAAGGASGGAVGAGAGGVELVTDDTADPPFSAGRRAPQIAAQPSDDDELDADMGAHEANLRRVLAALPNQGVREEDLRLSNARGQWVAISQPDPKAKVDKREAIRVWRLLLLLCARTGASDIHIEPRREDYLIRVRIDGMMAEALKLPQSAGEKIVGVVKVLCDIDIAQRNMVQEGHFSAALPNRTIDYRVSFTPSMFGQKLVVRVLDMGFTPKYLGDLGLPDWMFRQVRDLIRQDAGMLLCCGPTGSGKTTTLYSCIRDIDVSQRNVVTIEDPPEYQIDGVTQIPVNAEQGNTFSGLLRSILRQDPDVILVGEIRDLETARIALQASMTGHLVLSTVHARDGIGTIFRLLDLGAEPFLVASALNLVCAQRLVRKLCDHCKIAAPLKPHQVLKMGKAADNLLEIYYPSGCARCMNTGYSGRMGLYELLTTNQEMRDIILATPSMAELRKSLAMGLFSSLRHNGYKMVAEGSTSLDEVDRVVGAE